MNSHLIHIVMLSCCLVYRAMNKLYRNASYAQTTGKNEKLFYGNCVIRVK